MPEPWAYREISGADLPHPRYRANLSKITEGLASSLGSSYSTGCGHGGRQAARRLFRHPMTTVNGLLAGHFEQTAARCAGHDLVLCLQDTTVLDFTTHVSKSGLGRIGTSETARGLLAHSVFAVTPDGLPLGLFHLHLWARPDSDEPIRGTRRQRSTTDKESSKWLGGLEAVSRGLPSNQNVLLVQDREGDVYDLFAAPRRSRQHLLVRVCHPRRVELLNAVGEPNGTRTDLISAIEDAPVAGEFVVTIPRKPGQPEHQVRLSLQYRAMLIQPPRNGQHNSSDKPQMVTVIRACEMDPPSGIEPICWLLLTTMPVEDALSAERMVGYYAKRWMIERLHYTLKSGCNVERLQIDDCQALQNALAVYFMVAWRIMWITHLARTEPETPADEVLKADELQVLRAAAPKPIETIKDALREIARMAGYEPYANGPPPGMKRIWQGLMLLDALTHGWNLAKSSRK